VHPGVSLGSLPPPTSPTPPHPSFTHPTPLHHLQVFNENKSPFYEENMAAADPASLKALSEDDLIEANTKYSINGFLWCNVPAVNMTVGDK
jgi:hypothetical protein